MVPVVAVCVDVLPLGAVIVKVTLAPEAAVPPLVTDAVIETVLGREKLLPLVEMLTVSDGGAMTVAFAVADPVRAPVDAFRLTA